MRRSIDLNSRSWKIWTINTCKLNSKSSSIKLELSVFNKKVKEQTFKKGYLVLAVRRPMVMTYKTKEKFQPK